MKDDIPMLDTGENPEVPMPQDMIDLEVKFEKLESELRDVNSNAEALKRNYLELTELKHILMKTRVLFDEREGRTSLNTQNFLPEDLKGSVQLEYITGVILREKIPAFELALWRGEQVYKSVFIIFFQGDNLKMKVEKICQGFHGAMYPSPETPAGMQEMAKGVKTRLDDLRTVLNQTLDHRHCILVSIAREIRVWMTKVLMMKDIYQAFNMFNLDVIENGFIAECWIPVANLEDVQLALQRGTEKTGSFPAALITRSTQECPPTFHRTNKFT
ncbi:hypothetical protein Pmani_032370 [Petrolisthes manimaculis]|uniref:V-type proton ATPase subunit a n=1 Tax=Petrolisthes manimaculis TaxID=1843537 RepID=A0AAE1NTW1_9EUCA|nr:hypothetical protein Pmani_032370 [Petrolisthes manimaculis]